MFYVYLHRFLSFLKERTIRITFLKISQKPIRVLLMHRHFIIDTNHDSHSWVIN